MTDDSQHFDGLLIDDKRSPDGFKKIRSQAVLVNPNTGKLVLTGQPNEYHNCDQRGCGSLEHKIAELDVRTGLFEPVRNHTIEGNNE